MLPAGSIIICPSCKLKLAEVIKDIQDGDVLKAENLKSVGIIPENGKQATCKCGAYYFDATNGRVHTEKGWIS